MPIPSSQHLRGRVHRGQVTSPLQDTHKGVCFLKMHQTECWGQFLIVLESFDWFSLTEYYINNIYWILFTPFLMVGAVVMSHCVRKQLLRNRALLKELLLPLPFYFSVVLKIMLVQCSCFFVSLFIVKTPISSGRCTFTLSKVLSHEETYGGFFMWKGHFPSCCRNMQLKTLWEIPEKSMSKLQAVIHCC